jgi:hypothetical protein
LAERCARRGCWQINSRNLGLASRGAFLLLRCAAHHSSAHSAELTLQLPPNHLDVAAHFHPARLTRPGGVFLPAGAQAFTRACNRTMWNEPGASLGARALRRGRFPRAAGESGNTVGRAAVAQIGCRQPKASPRAKPLPPRPYTPGGAFLCSGVSVEGSRLRQSRPTRLLFFAFSEAIAAWQIRAAGYSLGRVEHPQHSDQEPLRRLASDRAPVD